MGICTWLFAGGTACGLAALIPKLRQRWPGELLVALVASMLGGAVATLLDFGGWMEIDWRAGLFTLFASFTAIGIYRLLRG
jgi:hypothetical protein